MSRRVRIWIQGYEHRNVATIAIDDAVYDIECDDKVHVPLIVDHEPDSTVSIQVSQGKISINNVEINHSWIINPELEKRFSQQIQTLLRNNCDLNFADTGLLQELKTQDLWLSSGADDFSATTFLINAPELNGELIRDPRFNIFIDRDQTLKFRIYHPLSADDFITRQHRREFWNPVQIPTQWCYDVDPGIIQTLDPGFHDFVERHIADSSVSYSQASNVRALPYSFTVRMQTELANNIDLIRDRRIIDFGCDRGQFLSACLDLGCQDITGAQIIERYNQSINVALQAKQQGHRARAVQCDVYDRSRVLELLGDRDTILFMGLIYHINNHYQLLQDFSQSPATGLIIDTMINDLDWYDQSQPEMRWKIESQSKDGNGIDHGSGNETTWVGMPNASWMVNALISLGWHIRSSTITSWLGLNQPQLRYRGTITAIR